MIIDTDITKPIAWMLKDGAFAQILNCRSENDLNRNSSVKTWTGEKLDENLFNEFDKDFIKNICVGTEYHNRYYIDLLSMRLFGKKSLGAYRVKDDIFDSGNYTMFGEYGSKILQKSQWKNGSDDSFMDSLNVDFLLFVALMADEGAYVRIGSAGAYDPHTPIVVLDDTIIECSVWTSKSDVRESLSGYTPGQPGKAGRYMQAHLIVSSPKTSVSPRILAILKASEVKKHDGESRFSMLVHKSSGWTITVDSMISDKPEIDFNLNYNEDLPVDKVRKFITSDDGNNQLMAFHGESGTGKTTFIRWLASEYPDTRFILLQGAELEYMSDSSFVDTLQSLKGSVLVIEDCETLLAKRVRGNSRIGTLLNLTDGILGASLKLKFICTFNSDKSNLDEALLRKGRMYMEYDFGKLSVDRCKALLQKIGKGDMANAVKAPMPLCDVYSIDCDNAGNVDRMSAKIGFGASK